ncbi:MAG: hypothetical protein V1487_04350 [bacterium]
MVNTVCANNYLKKLLTKIEGYVPTDEDKKSFSRDKVDCIFRKIDRKKFRRKQLGQESKNHIRTKIKISVDAGKPIHLVIPFGGYKHYWNLSRPEPDWAELFNFRYITEYILPILALYEPGVTMEYMSEDMILPRMNNYPNEVIEKYIAVFKKILTWYQKQVPPNLQLKFFRVSDRCNKYEIIKKVEALLPERREVYDELTLEKQEAELKRSYRSIYWNGKADWTNLSEPEKKNKIIESRLIELAYYDTESLPEFMGNYLGEEDHICICFSFGLSPDNAFDDLTLGSTFGSIADYWIGRGILISNGGQLHPRIVSAKQYEAMKQKIVINEVNLGLPGNNYVKIEVIPK